jgi:ribosome biogenesis GTPase
MSLKRYGWDDFFEKHHRETDSTLKPARVAAQYSNIYHLVGEETLLTAEVSGKYAYGTSRASDFPAVGDWVLMEKADE